jgi:hypothetical protein
MKKTRKNMLRSSVAMLLVSALALTTATYAWFTKGTSGKVSQLTLSAQNDSGIQLSVDAVNWKGTITASDISGQGSNDYSTNLSPKSSIATALDGKITLYSIEVNDETGVVTASVDDNKSGMIRFDLYVRNTGMEGKTFSLDTGNASVKGGTTTTGIENAIRVAFVYQGAKGITADNSADVTAVKNLKSNIVWLWEPNYTKHSQASMVTDGTSQPTYAIKSQITNGNGVTLDSKGIIPYDNNNSAYLQLVTASLADGSSEYSNATIATIPANSMVKFTVYIWLEGQDVDCIDQTANGDILVDLIFKDASVTSTSSGS